MVIDTVGRYLADNWKKKNPNLPDDYDPWSLRRIAQIKHEFDEQPEETKQKYPELFYYFDGLNGIKVSQSIHPAGIVISPVELAPEYGVFDKDGESCLLLDMDCVHDVGLVKYDMLVSKTVQVIKDTFKYIGKPYPKSHEVDWEDQAVWEDMAKSGDGIFQFESKFAQKYLRKFRPKNLFELSLVTASIRPSGESYRDDIMARRPHQNPSPQIDELLSDSLGYLVYQEQVIAFLQQLCGLSGSEADTIRRSITKKKVDEVEAAMPKIINGYCEQSPKPREEAENEVKEFLQVISDSASYMFSKNHSISYCMLSYLCGYLRYHHPIEFITAYLNNSANDEDARIGAAIAESKKIEVTMPKWGISRGDYFFDTNRRIIAKGLGSIKYMGNRECESLYALSQKKQYSFFVDLLIDLTNQTNLNSRQLSNLIKLDFFTDFGNQRELFNIVDTYTTIFKSGQAIKVSKEKVQGTPIGEIVSKYSIGTTKNGGSAKSYTLVDSVAALREIETYIKSLNLSDLNLAEKIINCNDLLGYAGYVSGRPQDRPILLVTDVVPAKRRKDGKQFSWNVQTKSIGSGRETRWTVSLGKYKGKPLDKGKIIYCDDFRVDDRGYFHLTEYHYIT